MYTTRRQLLVRLGLGSGVVALLSACGPAPQTPAPTAPAAAPKPTTAPAAGAPAATTAPAAAAKPPPPPPAAAPAAAGGGKAFNGAWPFEVPPSGHYNQYVPKGILGGPITPGG